jgi:hypothetical protein
MHGPALPDMDFRDRASSNFSSNIVSESGSTNFVEDLVRLQAEVAPMISFMISVVPPKIDWTRPLVQARPTASSRVLP